MKLFTIVMVLLAVSLSAFATNKSAPGGGSNPEATIKGSYTVEDINPTPFASGNYYGLALKDNATNSLWISNWSDEEIYEFSTTDLEPTGNSWTYDSADCDMDDLGWIVGFNQWIGGGYDTTPWASFWQEDGTFIENIEAPSGWTKVMAVAGNGYTGKIYVGKGAEIFYGDYNGDPLQFTSWSGPVGTDGCYGLAVYGPYLFAFLATTTGDNIVVYTLTGGVPDTTTPYWSCNFTEETTEDGGSLDYDGEYLYVLPQNGGLYKLGIDLGPIGIKASSLGEIKATFK